MNELERKDLQLLAEESDMDQQELQQSLESFIYPNEGTWAKFIRVLLLTLGVGFISAGIIFFFAYNWQDLPATIKLGLVQVLVLASVLCALFLKIDKLYKDIILTGSALLVGVMFAVFGQIYQTGANAYDFFLAWFLFISIWVWVSDFPPLWILYLGLGNLTIYLYWDQVTRDWDFMYLAAGLFVLNASILLICSWINQNRKGNIPAYFSNILALGASVWSVLANLNWILENNDNVEWVIIAATVLFYGIGLWHANRIKSIFYMGLIPFNVVIILVGVILKENSKESGFLFVSLLVVVSVSLIIWNIIKMQRRKIHG